jgi:hypothetical protein
MAILVFALVGGLAATISAANAMLNSEFSPPCYVGLLFGNAGNGQNTVVPMADDGLELMMNGGG